MEVVSLDLHAITKLRSDAELRLFLLSGPHPKRRGARRRYDGKVDFPTLSRSRTSEPWKMNRICICIPPWCGTRDAEAALALWSSSTGKTRPARVSLFWAHTNLHRISIVATLELYAARFQIEFSLP